MNNESLWSTLRNLRGNPRAAVWTEPLWGLSMALVLPYLSVFMLAVGLTDAQIGALATIGMVSQVFFGLAGGIITDKLGRRATTAWFDVVAWVIPCLIWFFAQNFWLFLLASLFNGALQVTQNSWDALMVEDAERAKIPRIYALVKVSADCSALFAPIAALMVMNFGLEHAVRILFINAAVVMTIKIIWLYFWCRETGRGEIRMAETRGVGFWTLFGQYRQVLGLLGRSRGSMMAMIISALVAAVTLVNGTFWQILASQRLGVPDEVLPFFPMIRALLSMLLLFTVINRLMSSRDLKRPTLLGFGIFLLGQVVLIFIPAAANGATAGTYALIGVCLLLDSFGAAMLFMLSESLVALHVDEAERSRVMALQRTFIMLAAAPFGWISGVLSGHSRVLPFVLTSVLLLLGLGLAAWKWVPTPDAEAHVLPAEPHAAT